MRFVAADPDMGGIYEDISVVTMWADAIEAELGRAQDLDRARQTVIDQLRGDMRLLQVLANRKDAEIARLEAELKKPRLSSEQREALAALVEITTRFDDLSPMVKRAVEVAERMLEEK
jgi:hypothetical protein